MEETKESIKYDPQKKYRWNKDDEFVLTGNEFGTILNALRGILGSPEAQRIIALERANIAIEEVMGRSVELGVVKEDIPKPEDFLGNLRKQ